MWATAEASAATTASPPKAPALVMGLGLDVAARVHGHLRQPAQVQRVGLGHDVHVLGAADVAPGVDREPSDQDAPDLAGGQAPEELVERGRAHPRRAAPV